jgi:hypothetical protein
MAPENESLGAEKVSERVWLRIVGVAYVVDLRSKPAANVHTTHLVRVDVIPIELVPFRRWILFRNICEIRMYIYVSLDHKLSCGLHDGTEITRLL